MRSVARAEPSSLEVSRVRDGNTAQMSAHAENHEDLLLDAAGLVALGVTKRLPVDRVDVLELFVSSLLDEDGLATPPAVCVGVSLRNGGIQ
jgi:hypothetical protein